MTGFLFGCLYPVAMYVTLHELNEVLREQGVRASPRYGCLAIVFVLSFIGFLKIAATVFGDK